MNKLKVMTVFGTRPEASKMAPVIQVLRGCPSIDTQVTVTAQHREQLDQVLRIFKITPDYDLNVMRARQTLADITTAALNGLDTVLREAAPDLVLVHGDTTTTLAASLAAYYNQIPLGHVEAGLRTYDKYQPFPEEINRRLTGVLADLHFAPTTLSKENLIKENIPAQTIYVTGNTAIDCLRTTLSPNHRFTEERLNHLDFTRRVITMTAHRRENLGRPLTEICRAVKRLAEEHEDVEVVYAVHLNPAVRETVVPILGGLPRVLLTEPLDIMDMHNLMNRSYMVLTDSGGLQEEVPSMGKPVVVLRNVTERPEAVEAGTVVLAGAEEESVYAAVRELLYNEAKYRQMARAVNPFGDGRASEKILAAILERWK
ncbi:MAG: UDP-N-acetylglucosamine 2-epimerase (non-hydrolyzing) [Clostridiales bacterium]|jgi:UDP-N-acetylglucosamine 2-epimerase|nr:UDP-N-acetylglucosamine 2-epimerase (non-hydrolyzing) [Clostridiales bacterium]